MCFLCVNLDAKWTLQVGEGEGMTNSQGERVDSLQGLETDLEDDGVIVDPNPIIAGRWL